MTSTCFDSRFNFSEFNIAPDSKNIKSVPGIDGIDFDILKKYKLRY